MAWTPTTPLLGTVVEFENFSFPLDYTEEAVDPVTGLTEEVHYPVRITTTSPKDTVTLADSQVTWTAPPLGIGLYSYVIVSGASISGFFKYVYSDIVEYMNFDKDIIRLEGTETVGTWEQFDVNDCYQMLSFKADTTRYRQFTYKAEAYTKSRISGNDVINVVSTLNFNIDVSDRNWTPGMTALRNAVATTKARGV